MNYEIRQRIHPVYNTFGETTKAHSEAPLLKIDDPIPVNDLQAVCINGRWFGPMDDGVQTEWEGRWSDAKN